MKASPPTSNSISVLAGTCTLSLALSALTPALAQPTAPFLQGKKTLETVRIVKRSGAEKFSPALQRLQNLYRPGSKGNTEDSYEISEQSLMTLHGLKAGEENPTLEIVVRVDAAQSLAAQKALQDAGAQIRVNAGNLIYVSIALNDLGKLQNLPSVRFADMVPAGAIPPQPKTPSFQLGEAGISKGKGASTLADFDRQGLTGKGVAIVVVDTGIDWKHPDFIDANGKSRILALWDVNDKSWSTSSGAIGSKPPRETPQGTPIGTLYTNAQLNAGLDAIRNGKEPQVFSHDDMGHGTACAGTAAGNGRATANGVPIGTYAGVAPEADLIVVNAAGRDQQGRSTGGISREWMLGTAWGLEYAKSLGKPCVVNQSFGGNYSAKDGSDVHELMLDKLTGKDKPGAVVCVAAGNEGQYSFHAAGRFGARRAGQMDVQSSPIDLFVTKATPLSAFFDKRDGWGLGIIGYDHFFVDTQRRPMIAVFTLRDGQPAGRLSGEDGAVPARPRDFQAYFSEAVSFQELDNQTAKVELMLVPGRYQVIGFATTDQVPNGNFDLYLPDVNAGSFGTGTTKEKMVGSPGTASSVITVGAYDFRGSWTNSGGSQTLFNLTPGEISPYTSPGYRRDQVVKPDIMAPATFTISSLSQGSAMGKNRDGEPDSAMITQDGYHLAWKGTSAATPYVAGVIALMLQKNPALDAAEIKEILAKTVKKPDSFTGGLPNPQWGKGKIDPAAALAATPRARTESASVSPVGTIQTGDRSPLRVGDK